MASIIQKPSALGSKTVYYNASAANAVMVNTDGTNGGWTGATVENG